MAINLDDTCLTNLTGCLSNFGLKLCDSDKDICLGRGYCITSIIPSPVSVCICYPCYYGNTCEKETYSRNLWMLGLPPLKSQILLAIQVFFLFFTVTQIINFFLCIQTYLSSQKIRITNVGICLIFNSIISLLIALEELIVSILLWFVKQMPYDYWRIQCLLEQKFVLISLTYIWGWSYLLIAFERMLVECYQYSLFGSRKRSLIILTCIFIICPLTTIPGIFTLKELPTNELYPQTKILLNSFGCVNYTSTGYTIYKVISGLHTYGALLSYILLCFVVLIHILKHRKRIAPDSKTRHNIGLVLHKHRDFFIPLIVAILCSIPMLIINEIMTCSRALTDESLPYLILVFGGIVGLIPTSFTFFYFIYPSNVYMTAFWTYSPVGRCLRKLKKTISR